MGDFARRVDAVSIRFERFLPVPPERLWPYLAESAKRKLWLAAGAFPGSPGETFAFHFRATELSSEAAETPERFKGFDGGHTVEYRLLAFDAPHRCRYRWLANACEVEFRFSPIGARSKLVLTHSGLADIAETVAYAAGWHTHLAVLRDVVTGRDPLPFWPMFAANEDTYRQRFER